MSAQKFWFGKIEKEIREMRVVLLGLAVSALVGPATADDGIPMTITCGALEGKTFWADEGGVTPADAGWDDEEFSSHRNRFSFTMTELGAIDPELEYKDATGRWYNPAGGEDAFSTITSARFDVDGDLNLQFMVVYGAPGGMASTVETYIFTNVMGMSAPTELIWSSSRVTEMFTSSKVLTGPCETTIGGG